MVAHSISSTEPLSAQAFHCHTVCAWHENDVLLNNAFSVQPCSGSPNFFFAQSLRVFTVPDIISFRYQCKKNNISLCFVYVFVQTCSGLLQIFIMSLCCFQVVKPVLLCAT